jgi:hypothetical protein
LRKRSDKVRRFFGLEEEERGERIEPRGLDGGAAQHNRLTPVCAIIFSGALSLLTDPGLLLKFNAILLTQISLMSRVNLFGYKLNEFFLNTV